MERSDRAAHLRGSEARERLNSLAPRVGPLTLARERLLAVHPALQGLFNDAALVRGTTVGCRGGAAMSVALAMVADASAAGSWVAVVGAPSVGLRAAREVGVALERLVMVADHAELRVQARASMVSALLDGFDIVVLRPVAGWSSQLARRLQARLQSRGGLLVIVGDPGPFVCDHTIAVIDAAWEGLGQGDGRLQRRRMTLAATGRRMPRERRAEVWLPDVDGGLEAVTAPTVLTPVDVGVDAVVHDPGLQQAG